MSKPSAVGTVVVAVLIAGGCGGSTAKAPADSLGTRLDASVPAAVLSAPLVDQNGKATTLSSFRGKAVVIGDSMTLCQEVCPLIGANFVQMARQMQREGDGSGVQFVQLTVDPERDTPGRLAAYRQLFSPAPANWSTLTGPAASIQRIWKFFGVGYSRVAVDSGAPRDWWTGKPLTYDVQHTDAVAFLDARQRERFLIIGAPNTGGEQPPARLRAFLSEEGRKNLNHPDPIASWTVQDGLSVIRWMMTINHE